MKLIALQAAFLTVMVASPLFAQKSSREDFEEFCRAFQGRWVGDVTWVADWEGFGKRGDKVTAYCEITIVEDGNALLGRYYGGNGSGTWLIVYDAGAKQIKSLWVNSGGGVSYSTLYKDGDDWIDKGTGSEADGAKTRSTNRISVTDNGNTHKWSGTGTVGGKPTDPLHDVWRRVSK